MTQSSSLAKEGVIYAIAETAGESQEEFLVRIWRLKLRRSRYGARKISYVSWTKTLPVELRWQDVFAELVERRFRPVLLMEPTYEIISPIQSVSPIMGDKIVLKLGVFAEVPEPEYETFAVRRQHWEVSFAGCVQYKLLGGPGKEKLELEDKHDSVCDIKV